MHLSYRWLARHVDLSGITPQQLAADLTLSTAEVEGLSRFAPCLSDVTVGLVKTRIKHPDSDHLSVCTVDVGQGEPLQIVCGAPNVDAGQKVAVALAGVELPGGLKLKKTKIRGQESNGMICSERELGLGEEHSGIWVLAPSAEVGRPVAAALDLEDWVIEIDNKSVTHRPDLWGHRGFAREIAAIHSRALKPLDTSLPAAGSGPAIPVKIESQACPRYLALALEGVANGRSPDWMRHLLLAVGQRPIDLLVDLSNFVMLDLGQPNHLFDRQRLAADGIVVREARAGERMQTLDGEERALESTDLLITSGGAPVALAGVMGGEASKVEAGTQSLVLEVASFLPAGIRRTSARLGLRSEASARFEKHLSPTLVAQAAGHLVRLLQSIQPGARIAAPVSDAGAWQDPARTLSLRPARVREVLGIELSDEDIRSILTRLELLPRGTGAEWSVSVPAIRATKDLTAEHDLIEEVGRIHRYGNIAERPLSGELTPVARDPRLQLVRRIEDRLAGGAHFHQTISYSFLPDGLLESLGTLAQPHVQVVNPVAEGVSRLRREVFPSLLTGLVENRRQRADVRVFEIGKGYLPEHPNAQGEPREVHELALLWARAKGADAVAAASWNSDLLLHLQGVVEDLLLHLGLASESFRAAAVEQDDRLPRWANPGRAKRLGNLGFLAHLDPALARRLGLSGELASDAAGAVLSIDALLSAPRRSVLYRSVPRFPGTKVDVALAVPTELPADQGVAAIERAGKGLVAGTELFDLYQGPNLGPGRKSLAWHVLLQDENRTLDEQDGQKFQKRLRAEVERLGGELRSE
jgi:phenylalanyl-tRNA synthetase beta chain